MKIFTQKTSILVIALILSLINFRGLHAQCSNFGSQYPSGVQSTTSPTLSNVATCFYGGDYARYNVTLGETYTWTTCGDTDFDTQLTLWNTAHTTSYAYNDDVCGLQSTITWTATFTGQVDVLVSRFNCIDETTCMTVQWACTSCAATPPNNLCSGATNLPCGTTNLAGTTVNSTNVADQAGCASSYGVWYRFVGDGLSNTISSSATFDHEMVIYNGSCGTLINIACRDASTGTETYTFTPTLGLTYFVYIAHYLTGSSTTGTFTISRTCSTPPITNIIPTVCNTATYTLPASTSTHFYDDGGPGGDCNTDGAVGNFANAGCETITTICAAPGEYLIANFSVFSMYNTPSGFDWMVIYEGPTTGGAVLFDNRMGAINNPVGTSCDYDGTSLSFCAVGRCLTFRFYASSVVNREGWDALVMSVPVECVPLPVSLLSFIGEKQENINRLSWKTESELNNDYFILEQSTDGFAWRTITKENGAGNSTDVNSYSFDHSDFQQTINYYRLTQVDFDGKRETFDIISIDNSTERKLVKRFNTLGQEVDENFKGIVIEYYDDNTHVKRLQK